MRVVTETALATVLGRLAGMPPVVASGNFATPWQALRVLDAAVAQYRLFVLNAQPGIPDRDGVILESPFAVLGALRGRRRPGGMVGSVQRWPAGPRGSPGIPR
jgi:hypothetical protein